jgi:hypothetical protein
MFKSVEYAGFEGHPELRAKAEQLTPVLANEIRRWRTDVEVQWAPDPASAGALTLALALALPNGVAGARTGTFEPDDLAESWLIRSRCRSIWSDLLGDLSQQLDARLKEAVSEPLEV